MDLSTFIVSVFCLIDDRIKKEHRIRRCRPTPKLSDAEVLTILRCACPSEGVLARGHRPDRLGTRQRP